MEIGCDIEKIERFNGKKDDLSFLKRIFTDKEIEYCMKYKNEQEHFCARFCAKEAIIKALPYKIPYNKIEILNNKDGKPYVNILSKKYKGEFEIKISISHCDNYAMASAVIY